MSTSQNIVPKLVQESTATTPRREFTPRVVTRLGGTLPWDTDSVQLDCGETITEVSGDQNIRIVYHCVAPRSELETLELMRQETPQIKIVSSMYTGPATFDQMKIDRIADNNGTIVNGGNDHEEPMYEVQLQTKEESDDNEGFSFEQ